MKAKNLTQTALLAASICVLAPWTLPAGSFPVTLGTFAVSLAAGIGGRKKGTAAVVMYILLGAVGLPVFAGFSGGIHVIFNATGGFILGYIPLSLCVGAAYDKKLSYFACVLYALFGHLIMYLCAVLCYCAVTKASFISALAVCVLPFIFTDILKILASCALSMRLRDAIRRSGK